MMKSINPKFVLVCLALGCGAFLSFGAGVFQKISASGYHSLAIASNGTLWAWGTNSFGELGDGTTASRVSAEQIGVDNHWQSISAGEFHNLALKTDGTLWAWGNNSNGQLGDGTTANALSPIQIGSATDWKLVAAGAFYSLAIKTNGTLWAWGANSTGQLGDTTTAEEHSLIQIGSDTDWAFVTAGQAHSLAVKTNGTLWAWGKNNFGMLGDGTTTQTNSPEQIGADTDWNIAAAGFFHTLGLKTNGTLWAWGGNFDGQLGDGTINELDSPTQIGSATNWQIISAGQTHSVAMATDGSIWAWGFNAYGQLGNGTTNDAHAPFQIGSETNWTGLVAGLFHTVALKSDGSVWDSGSNNGGQLANGTTDNQPNMVKVLLTATVTLNSLAQTYDGSPKTVPVTTVPSGFSVTVTYDGSANGPVNQGSYAVVATGIDSDYYGKATGTLVINKATAPVALGNLLQYFDGTIKSVSVVTVPVGLPVDVTYNGSPSAPSAVGNYAVVAAVNDSNYQGSTATNLIITLLPNALAKGAYAGLFYESNHVTHQSSGYFSLTIDAKWKIGGRIFIEGGSYPLTGTFNTNSAAASVSVLRTGTNTLAVNLQLSSDGSSGSVSGSVSDGVWNASLMGYKNFYSLTNPCPQAGNYAMTFLGVGNGTSAPDFGTRGIVKVKSTGSIALSGQLADDVALAQTAILSKAGQWPFYIRLYKGAGSALGWITFTNSLDYKLTGNVSWIKTGAFGTFYSAGFTNTMAVYGSIRQ